MKCEICFEQALRRCVWPKKAKNLNCMHSLCDGTKLKK